MLPILCVTKASDTVATVPTIIDNESIKSHGVIVTMPRKKEMTVITAPKIIVTPKDRPKSSQLLILSDMVYFFV